MKLSSPGTCEWEFEESATPPSCVCMRTLVICKFTRVHHPLPSYERILLPARRESSNKKGAEQKKKKKYIYFFFKLDFTTLCTLGLAHRSLLWSVDGSTHSDCECYWKPVQGVMLADFEFLQVTDNTHTGFFFVLFFKTQTSECPWCDAIKTSILSAVLHGWCGE